jgi:murein DD-endopeptidase MepM/ murein hydrolase activator NlpD
VAEYSTPRPRFHALFNHPVLSSSRDHFRLHYLDVGLPNPQGLGHLLRSQRSKLLGLAAAVAGTVALTAFGLAPSHNQPETPAGGATQTIQLTGSAAPDNTGELSDTSLTLYSSTRGDRGDTVRTLLRRLEVKDDSAETFLRADKQVRDAVNLGRQVRAHAQYLSDGRLEQLKLTWLAQPADTNAQVLTVTKTDAAEWTTALNAAPLSAQTRLVSGTITSSLFAATDRLGLDDSIASGVAEIFANDIDFRRDLRKGDRFTVAFEEWTADGDVLRTGQILAAEFVNKGQPLQAIWFEPKGEFFDAKGQSSKRQFLGSPMKFSRVTSGFSMRLHPIHKTWKRHLGVDYGAPTGTPVRSVGAGRVTFAGVQRGYGNVVEIQHDARNATLYAHLSRIDVRKGQTVEREQNIGAVGQTGWATGPHLHFEFRVDGAHRDPAILAKRSKSLSLTPKELAAFKPLATKMQQALAAGSPSSTASAR